MIRVAHLIPVLEVGGAEQMVLELCRHRDRTRFECVVAAGHGGPIVPELEAAGAYVYVGPGAFRQAVAQADLVNLHWWAYDEAWIRFLHSRGTPFVTTLHSLVVLPALPAVTICTSEHARRIQRYPERCVVIPNGVDIERFRPPERRVERDEVIITRVCRPPKCAPYFWDAMRRILDRYPQVRLRVAGSSPQTRSADPRVELLGVRRDVPEILAGSDLFVYTPYPGVGTQDLVVMEASAAGLPAVVSDVQVVDATVVDGVNGYRVPFGETEALAAAVARLVEDRPLRLRIAQQARSLAEERFGFGPVARSYETIYQAVLQNRA